MKVIDETNHNFSLEFVDNGAILTYDDNSKQVVQTLNDKEVFNFIAQDMHDGLKDMKANTNNYYIEIKIKAKE